MKASSQATLSVRSHVGRDLLASAAVFKTEEAVVWEYVVNSLQYVDRAVSPNVLVEVAPRKHQITIADNGCGMGSTELVHFFTMHGENLERRAGRPGRGKFGTGKAAAFGIADRLLIETVRNGHRNEVLLTRRQIDDSNGEEIPLTWIARDEATDAKNGTRVTISEVRLNRIDTTPIVSYIERHLGVFRSSNPVVVVNNHVCEHRPPAYSREIDFTPSPEQVGTIGAIRLTIRVAQAPLSDAEQGVMVTAGEGNLVAIEKAGMDRKEHGAYLCGDVDCAALDAPGSSIEPYDMTRTLQLNPRHAIAMVLIGFIGASLEAVRLKLVQEARKARETEAARRLAAESERIAEILNADFADQRRRLSDVRSVVRRASGAAAVGSPQPAGSNADAWAEGLDEPGLLEKIDRPKPNEGAGPRGAQPPNLKRSGRRDPEGDDSVSKAGGEDGRRERPRSGFQVEYRSMGTQQRRSEYEPKSMTILVNLDHPLVHAALGQQGTDDPGFRRLSYEIAFTEYALALAVEVARHDPGVPADDLLFDVRATLDRVSRAATHLYQTNADRR